MVKGPNDLNFSGRDIQEQVPRMMCHCKDPVKTQKPVAPHHPTKNDLPRQGVQPDAIAEEPNALEPEGCFHFLHHEKADANESTNE